DLNAALGTAERYVHHGGFPGHQAGQRAHFVQVHVRVIAKPALEGPSRIIMLDAIADVVADGSIVQLDDDLDSELASRRPEQGLVAAVQLQRIEGLLQVSIRSLISTCHETSSLDWGW